MPQRFPLFSRHSLAMIFAVAALATARAADPLAAFSADGKQIVVEADGIKSWRFGSSILFKDGDKAVRVGSRAGEILGRTGESIVETPFGPARMSSVTYGAPGEDVSYTLDLKVLEGIDAIALQVVLHNRGSRDIFFDEAAALDTKQGGRFEVDSPANWLVTPLMEDTTAMSLPEAKQGFREALMLYNNKGKGFVVGPSGPPEAFATVEISEGSPKAYANMDGVLVKAGESRRGEQMVVVFGKPDAAVKIWTRWVAATHGARLHRGPVYGWCSWYDRTTNIDEAHVREVLDILAGNPDVFGRGILQIDDGYQVMDGDWNGNKKFPSGLAALAKDIRDKGWVPGVWFAPLMMNPSHPFNKANPDAIQKDAQGIASFMNANPFHPSGANWLVPDHPESKKFLFNIVKDARDRGFGYIKIDFNGIGSRFHDPTKTRLQIFRDLYTLYRAAAGEEMIILSCLGQPTRGVIGFIDAARVGPDSHPEHFEKCLKSVLRFQIFDNVWWRNDPDVSYFAPKLASRRVGQTSLGQGMWRSWHNIVTLVGGTAMNSEPLGAPDAKEVWRMAEIMRPGSREPARLLTLGLSPDNTAFGFAAQRPYGNFAVWNLYNSTEAAKPLTLDLPAAGLPPGVECAVFDFWENKVVARVKNTYTTPALEHFSSALLRFTPLGSGNPVLVGSNLHLSIGATEINDIRTTPNSLEVILSDAGAQEGSLTFHSKHPLAAVGSENCEIGAVTSLGEDLWRVDLKGRKWGKPQSIRLSIDGAKSPAGAGG